MGSFSLDALFMYTAWLGGPEETCYASLDGRIWQYGTRPLTFLAKGLPDSEPYLELGCFDIVSQALFQNL